MRAKIDCFKVLLGIAIERYSGKKMFLKSYSSTAVKSSGSKNKNTITIKIFLFKTSFMLQYLRMQVILNFHKMCYIKHVIDIKA